MCLGKEDLFGTYAKRREVGRTRRSVQFEPTGRPDLLSAGLELRWRWHLTRTYLDRRHSIDRCDIGFAPDSDIRLRCEESFLEVDDGYRADNSGRPRVGVLFGP